MTASRGRHGLRSGVAAAALVLCVSGLAACGSHLDPDDVRGAGGTAAEAGPGSDGAAATDGGPVDPGQGAAPGTDGAPLPDGSDGVPVPGGPAGGDGADGPDGTDPTAAPGPGDDGPPVVPPGEVGDCDGFENGPGITDTTLTIGNSSDISGPVPGLFQASRDATTAFVAYFNAAFPDGICGRKLALELYDSRTDATADQQAYAAGCDDVFAMVGSMSAFDSGGAATAEDCGLPDVRSTSVTVERNRCGTCFGAQSTNTGEVQNATPDYIVKTYPDEAKRAAFFFIDAGAAAQNGPRQAAAMEKRGMDFDVVQGIGTSEFNYVPYVQQLKDNDIAVVFFTGAYQQSARLRQAMAQQGYEPTLYVRDPTDYQPGYVQVGGAAVDGTVVYLNFVPFEEASRNPEMSLYLSYLERVKPGAAPSFFGVFSWSAARLFVEKALALGGDLTRESLVSSLRATKDWDGNGLHAEQHPGPHRTGECFRLIRLTDGRWTPLGGTAYRCSGTTTVS